MNNDSHLFSLFEVCSFSSSSETTRERKEKMECIHLFNPDDLPVRARALFSAVDCQTVVLINIFIRKKKRRKKKAFFLRSKQTSDQ